MTEENTQNQQNEEQTPEEQTGAEETQSEGAEQEAADSAKEESSAEETQEEQSQEAESSSEASPEESSTEESSSDEGEEVEVPEKFQPLVEQIEQMSVLDLNELVKTLEKKFGVSAAATAAPAGGAADGGGEAEEQTIFDVELSSAGEQKVSVIKVIKEVLGLGLKEAKEFVEGAPQVVKEKITKEEADELKGKIEEAGGQAEIK